MSSNCIKKIHSAHSKELNLSTLHPLKSKLIILYYPREVSGIGRDFRIKIKHHIITMHLPTQFHVI